MKMPQQLQHCCSSHLVFQKHTLSNENTGMYQVCCGCLQSKDKSKPEGRLQIHLTSVRMTHVKSTNRFLKVLDVFLLLICPQRSRTQ